VTDVLTDQVRPMRLDEMPASREYVEVPRDSGALILAHSETGHHHAVRDVEAVLLRPTVGDGLTTYLRVDGDHADVVHERPWDTHETLRLPRGVWLVRRQREWTPEGWRRVED
jgi:hypothetical protein